MINKRKLKKMGAAELAQVIYSANLMKKLQTVHDAYQVAERKGISEEVNASTELFWKEGRWQ